jgi:Uma2 family endonuclease
MHINHGKPVTPADLSAMADRNSYELVNGKLVVRNGSVLSSLVAGRLSAKLSTFCQIHELGTVLGSSNGVRCFPDDPDKVRKPDFSFVKRERFTDEHFREEFLTTAPDLIFLVISPYERASALNKKIEDHRSARIALVWVIDPQVRNVVVYRGNGTVSMLHGRDELTGEDVVPGFRCKVADLFPEENIA